MNICEKFCTEFLTYECSVETPMIVHLCLLVFVLHQSKQKMVVSVFKAPQLTDHQRI